MDVKDVTILNYSEKAIAVFGETKPIKDDLKKLGGRFNMHLKHGPSGRNMPGWIFPSKSRGAVENLVNAHNQTSLRNSVDAPCCDEPPADLNGNGKMAPLQGSVAETTDDLLSTWSSVTPVIPPTITPTNSTPSSDLTASSYTIPHVISYSEKAIAVFGETKPIKDDLKKLGGRFNMHLKHGPSGRNMPGWIFPSKSRGAVENLVNAHNQTSLRNSVDAPCCDEPPSDLNGNGKMEPLQGSVAETTDDLLSTWSSVTPVIPPTITPTNSTPSSDLTASSYTIPHVISYSEKAIAVFGETKPIKDDLKKLGGRFNKHLKHGPSGRNMPGWIFPSKSRGAVENLVNEYSVQWNRDCGNVVGTHDTRGSSRASEMLTDEPSIGGLPAIHPRKSNKRKLANFVVPDEECIYGTIDSDPENEEEQAASSEEDDDLDDWL